MNAEGDGCIRSWWTPKKLVLQRSGQAENGGREEGEGERRRQEAGAQEEGEIQPREMIINEAIHPRSLAPARDREAARRQKFARRGDKVRRIEDDVKNKRSVFTTVWNWTASPREKWGSPTLCRENDIVCYGAVSRAKTTRQGGGGAVVWSLPFPCLNLLRTGRDCHLVFIVRRSLTDQRGRN